MGETILIDQRERAVAGAELAARTFAPAGTPETRLIAREHLAACFACTLRTLPEKKGAALLLKEVYGFSLAETADILDATEIQAKNWMQEARKAMRTRHDDTCALIAKTGVVHQCEELGRLSPSQPGTPIGGPENHMEARLGMLGAFKSKAPGKWRLLMLDLLEELDRLD